MRTLALVPLLLLAACEVGPNYVKPDLKAPPAYAEAASTNRTALTAQDADLSRWWTQFGDPELDSLVERALKDNPDLDAASSRVRAARQQEKAAAAKLLPEVIANGAVVKYDSQRNAPDNPASSASGAAAAGSQGLSFLPSHETLYSAGFDALWEVDIFGGTRRGIEQAKANREASEWQRRDGEVSLVAETANAYLTLRAAQARIALGQAQLKRQQDLYALIGARRRTGFVTELDVNQQNVQVATVAAQIPQSQALAAAQIHALGVLIGQTPESLERELGAVPPPTENPTLPPPPPVLPTGLPSELLERRPDVRESERKLAAASAQIGVQTANLYPKLNLIGLASFASPKIGELFDSQNFSTLGVGAVQAPLFEGGRLQASVAQAREAYQQDFQAYRTAVLGAFRDVEDALARFKAEDERRSRLADAVKASEGNLTIAEAQYKTGLVPFINVLQAQTNLINSRDQLVQTDSQALTDLVSLYKALGGGWLAED